jgi:hypothetical protein
MNQQEAEKTLGASDFGFKAWLHLEYRIMIKTRKQLANAKPIFWNTYIHRLREHVQILELGY